MRSIDIRRFPYYILKIFFIKFRFIVQQMLFLMKRLCILFQKIPLKIILAHKKGYVLKYLIVR
jgi:hypothetical protein